MLLHVAITDFTNLIKHKKTIHLIFSLLSLLSFCQSSCMENQRNAAEYNISFTTPFNTSYTMPVSCHIPGPISSHTPCLYHAIYRVMHHVIYFVIHHAYITPYTESCITSNSTSHTMLISRHMSGPISS